MDKGQLKILREKVLSDCRPDKAFWTCNGTIARNIYELVNAVRALNADAFKYHVNDDNNKNDFAKWIDEVLEDRILAKQLDRIRDKDKYLGVIEKRIKLLESVN
jgi:hypothetical protein